MYLLSSVQSMTSVRYPAFLLGLALLVAPRAAPAQDVPPPGTSAEEIQEQITARGLQSAVLQRLQASGMTPAEIRQRLASMGYDPSTLDPYLSDDTEPPPRPSADALTAAEALGILAPEMADDTATMARADSLLRADSMAGRPMLPDSSALERERGLRVFGLETFARATTEFRPVTTGPVPPGYTVGPGDELVLILTGDVEQSYNLPVTREGFIVIPQVGQVWVNGLTMAEIRDHLYTQLGRSYSGIGRGPEATTHFQLTLGQLRPNQVFVAGQVVQPGSYMPSAVASALNALYLGRGPLPAGSFRDVRVMRSGELAQRVDLYQYLVQGHNLADIRLQPGDVIFVPAAHAQVSIEGEVPRPAIYEVLPGETVADLVAFAGGLSAPAQTRRARIERILPPEERTVPGVDRVVIDVDLAQALDNPELAPELRDGDAVRIFPVRPELRRWVSIQGAVWGDIQPPRPDTAWTLPGDSLTRDTSGAAADRADRRTRQADRFRYYDGMRLWDLIELAGGLRDDAYTDRAQIVRVDPQDSTVTMIPTTLERDANGEPVANPELREFDTVRVFRASEFTTAFPISIDGEVRNPMDTIFEEGMTLRDLILRAGGLQPTADLEVEVARIPDPELRDTDTIARVIRVRVDSSFMVSPQAREYHLGQRSAADGAAAEFLLRPYDRVTVRMLPDFELQRTVQVRGFVRQPGYYTLERKGERLSALIARTRGLKNEAYAGGARLFRDGVRVNVDLEAALARPGGRDDLELLQGDSLFVPEYNPVVTVRGAVNGEQPIAIQYRPGVGLAYYIDNAGGYARNADVDRVHIRYANGTGAVMGRFLMFQRAPRPEAGAVITVPFVRDEDRVDVTSLIADIAQIAATLTTIALVIARL